MWKLHFNHISCIGIPDLSLFSFSTKDSVYLGINSLHSYTPLCKYIVGLTLLYFSSFRLGSIDKRLKFICIYIDLKILKSVWTLKIFHEWHQIYIGVT